MKNIFFISAFLTSFYIQADAASVLYCNLWGEFFIEDHYALDIDVEKDSINTIKERFLRARKKESNGQNFDADTVIIGYGKIDNGENFFADAKEFFATTKNLSQTTPLKNALPFLPSEKDKTWHIYFVSSQFSYYLNYSKPLHWSAPKLLGFLVKAGQQNLKSF